MEYQNWRAGPIESNIPKGVKFASQSIPSQNRVGKQCVSVRRSECDKEILGRNVCHNNLNLEVNACGGNSIRQSRRTTIVAHRSACFG